LFNWFSYVLAVASAILLFASAHTAFAAPTFISIIQSDTCKLSTTCLGLDDLIPLDNSDKNISGKFKQDKNGNIYRTKPQVKNHYAFYQTHSKEPILVFVEPDLSILERSKVIQIESTSNMVYVKPSDNMIKDNTFYQYKNRVIDSCSSATIASDLDLLKDTIQYLGNDCKVSSKYTDQVITVKPKTPHLDCSYACMNEKWMKQAKAKAKAGFLIKPDIKLKTSNGKVKLYTP
jgi:hypothetical protein